MLKCPLKNVILQGQDDTVIMRVGCSFKVIHANVPQAINIILITGDKSQVSIAEKVENERRANKAKEVIGGTATEENKIQERREVKAKDLISGSVTENKAKDLIGGSVAENKIHTSEVTQLELGKTLTSNKGK